MSGIKGEVVYNEDGSVKYATGGMAAKLTNIEREPDFYARIGAIGGKNGKSGGFASDRELARRAGRLGGLKSRRGPNK